MKVFGEPVAKNLRRVGYVPQRESVDWDFPVSVMDVVLMGRYGKLGLLKRPTKADHDKARECLDKVKMLPDGSGNFTRRMGMLIKKDHLGFGDRSWRYSMVVDDGRIVAWFEEPGINDAGTDDDPYGESAPDKVLSWLQEHPAKELADA